MATDETGIVPAADAELSSSPKYRKLLADCQEICESGRRSTLLHYWALGERISRELPESHEDRYGAQIIVQLEKDLRIADRTTLTRAVQLYRAYTKRAFVPHGTHAYLLTWSKMKMLLPLPEDLRKRIERQILSGKLRTDDDVRSAIEEAKRKLGLLPPPVMGDADPDVLGVKGVKAGQLRTLWRRATPLDRALLVRALIPELELDRIERQDALGALRAMRQQLDDYEERLGEAE